MTISASRALQIEQSITALEKQRHQLQSAQIEMRSGTQSRSMDSPQVRKAQERAEELARVEQHLANLRAELAGDTTTATELRAAAHVTEGSTRRRSAGGPRVGREADPSPYAPGKQQSMFADLERSMKGDAAARERLGEHRRVSSPDMQTRDMAVVNAVGEEFAPPTYAGNMLIDARIGAAPVALGLASQGALPDTGSSVVLPKFTSAASVGTIAQTNPLNTLTESTPGTDELTIAVVERGGYVDLSNFLRDRTHITAGLDGIILRQLGNQIHSALEAALIADIRASGDVNAVTATAATPNFPVDVYPKLMEGAAAVVADELVVAPTHLVVNPRRAFKWASERSSDERPYFSALETAHNPAGTMASNGIAAQGDTGLRIMGLPVIGSHGVSTQSGAGTNEDSCYIGAWAESVLVMTSPLIVQIDMSTLSANSGVRIVARQYTAHALTRPTGICKLTGTAFAAPVWA